MSNLTLSKHNGAPTETPEQFDSVCVFCGSQFGTDPGYRRLAEELGQTLAARSLRLVYGGGGIGLMGATARSAYEAGGKVLGIIPRFLLSREMVYDAVPHEIVENMHDRKARMYAESDAFIVLAGGIGTLEEAIEVLSWARLNLHSKPMAFLSHDDYWSPLMSLLLHTIDKGFAPASLADQFFAAQSITEALSGLERRARRNRSPSDIGSV